MTPEYAIFVEKLLKLTSKHEYCEELYWDENLEFYVLCNDLFYWGAADAEDILPKDLTLLEQCLQDDEFCGTLLYCARKRKMRPQNAAYPAMLLKETYYLFDECGPERAVGALNPEVR